MLTRVATLASLAVVICIVVPSSSRADNGPVNVTGNNDGVVSTSVAAPGQSGSDAPGTTQDVSYTSSPCTWVEVFSFQQVSLPLAPGGVAGNWWQEYCGKSGWNGMPVFVPEGTPTAAVLQVSAGTLAQKAVNQLLLPAPTVGLNPSPRALVNLAEWFWVRRSSWPTLRQRTQAGRVWAVVVAEPTSTTWDPGDGSRPFTCAGAGTPYVKSEPADAQHTDCSYAYRRSSASQPQTGPDPNDRFFTVRVTTTWSVTWTGAGGTGGSLPAMSRSTSFPLAVAEREAVVTGGSG